MQDENGELSQDSRLVQFLLNPNEEQNFKEFSKEFIRNLYACGFSYLLPYSKSDSNLRRLDKLDGEGRAQLLVLNTDCIEYPEVVNKGLLDTRNRFRYHVGSYYEDILFDNVIPFYDKNQDPNNRKIGISRLSSLKDEITNIILADRAKTNKIKQSGKFLVTPASKNVNSTFGNQLDQPVNIKKPDFKQRDLLEQTLETTGLAQGKSITVAKEELQSINMMESIQGYSYDDEVSHDRMTVKSSLGLPKELHNSLDSTAKYENRQQALLEMLTIGTIPLATNFTESIQNYYEPSEKRRLILDYSHHPVFQITETKKQEGIKYNTQVLIDLFDRQVITSEELREKLEANEII